MILWLLRGEGTAGCWARAEGAVSPGSPHYPRGQPEKADSQPEGLGPGAEDAPGPSEAASSWSCCLWSSLERLRCTLSGLPPSPGPQPRPLPQADRVRSLEDSSAAGSFASLNRLGVR